MVLAGIGVELLADAGVFLFSERLQRLEGADIQALDTKSREAGEKASDALGKSSEAMDKSEAADSASKGALNKSGKAEHASISALELAMGARKEADSFEKDIVSAKTQAAEAEAHLAEALRRVATAEQETARLTDRFSDRTMTDEQVRMIADKLRSFSGQEFEAITYPDLREPMALFNRIIGCLAMGGWRYIPPERRSDLLGGVSGVQVYIHSLAGDQVRKGADSLVSALIKEGIAASLRLEPPQVPQYSRVKLVIGTKP